MTDGTYDPALFGAWTPPCTYGVGAYDVGQAPAAEPFDDAFRLVLDRKSADMPAGDELMDMLNGMTRRQRREIFRRCFSHGWRRTGG